MWYLGGLKVSETQIFVVLEGPKVSETPVWAQRRKHKANTGGRVDNSAGGRREDDKLALKLVG